MSMFLCILYIIFLLVSQILSKHIRTIPNLLYRFSQSPTGDDSLADSKKETWGLSNDATVPGLLFSQSHSAPQNDKYGSFAFTIHTLTRYHCETGLSS